MYSEQPAGGDDIIPVNVILQSVAVQEIIMLKDLDSSSETLCSETSDRLTVTSLYTFSHAGPSAWNALPGHL